MLKYPLSPLLSSCVLIQMIKESMAVSTGEESGVEASATQGAFFSEVTMFQTKTRLYQISASILVN